jgi:hypothetical protein
MKKLFSKKVAKKSNSPTKDTKNDDFYQEV